MNSGYLYLAVAILAEVIAATRAKYAEALQRLAGIAFD